MIIIEMIFSPTDIVKSHPEAEESVKMLLKVGHGGVLEESASGVLGKVNYGYKNSHSRK